MSLKLTLKSLLSETRKLVYGGNQKIDYFKEEVYRHVSQSYSKLSQIERYEYLNELSYMHDYNKEKLLNIKVQDTTSDALRIRRMFNIKEHLQPKYREFFIKLGRVPDGIKLLVDLRSDIIDIQRLIGNFAEPDSAFSSNKSTHMEVSTYTDLSASSSNSVTSDEKAVNLRIILRNMSSPENLSNLFVLNAELKDLINVWFSGGFCQLERVTWDSSCQLLQRISELEAVHPIKGWVDIKRRVGTYRRCYVFTHPCMPKEPVVILHTALCSEIPGSIREIVQRRFTKEHVTEEETEDPSKIKAAIFYSISSPHTGLNGIDLGNTLIKRVVQTLLYEFHSINQFSTLSPIPGFRRWLDTELHKCLGNEINSRIMGNDSERSFTCSFISPLELTVLTTYFNAATMKDLLSQLEMLLERMSRKYNSSKNLLEQADRADNDYMVLSWFLKTMAAKYLYSEKRRGYALDNVCNFHLRNGAIIWRINWPADSSFRGIQNSYGVMVNYRYYIEHTENYSREYMENKTIEVSSEVQDLLRGDLSPDFTANRT